MGHDSDFNVLRMTGVAQKPSPHLLDYVRSITGNAGRQEAVSKLTDQLSNIGWKMTPAWRNLLVAEKMMPREGSETAWATNRQLAFLAKRYSLPIAFYNPGDIHWMAITAMPVKSREGWRAPVYNPMKPGEKEIVIPEKQMDVKHILVCNPLSDMNKFAARGPASDDDFEVTAATSGALNSENVVEDLQRLDQAVGGFDIRIPEFDGELAGLTIAKTAPLQTTEGHNCGFWSLEHTAVAWGIQPGDNVFKERGLRQLASDTGVVVVTPEGIMAELFSK